MPDLSWPVSSWNSQVTRNVPVPLSTTGLTRATVPVNFFCGSASTTIATGSPAFRMLSSRSGTFSTASSGSKSSMRNSACCSWMRLPSFTMRSLITPSIGATMRV